MPERLQDDRGIRLRRPVKRAMQVAAASIAVGGLGVVAMRGCQSFEDYRASLPTLTPTATFTSQPTSEFTATPAPTEASIALNTWLGVTIGSVEKGVVPLHVLTNGEYESGRASTYRGMAVSSIRQRYGPLYFKIADNPYIACKSVEFYLRDKGYDYQYSDENIQRVGRGEVLDPSSQQEDLGAAVYVVGTDQGGMPTLTQYMVGGLRSVHRIEGSTSNDPLEAILLEDAERVDVEGVGTRVGSVTLQMHENDNIQGVVVCEMITVE